MSFFNEIKNYKLNLFNTSDIIQDVTSPGSIKFNLDQLSNDELGLILSLIYIIKIQNSNQLVKVDKEEHDEDIIDLKKYFDSVYLFGLKNDLNNLKKEITEVIHYFNNLPQNKILKVLNSQYSPNFLIELLSNKEGSELGYMYLSVCSYVNEEIWDDSHPGYLSKLNLLRERFAKELFDNGSYQKCFDLENEKFYEIPVFKGGYSLDFMFFENYVRFGDKSIFYIMNESLSKNKNEEYKSKYLYYFSCMSSTIIRDDQYKFLARVGQKYFKNINIYDLEHNDIFNNYRSCFLRNLKEKGFRFAIEMLKFVDLQELDNNLISLSNDSNGKAQIALDIQSLTLLDFYNKYTPENLSDLKNANFLSNDRTILNHLLAVNGWFFYLIKLTNNIENFFEENDFKTDLKIFLNRKNNTIFIDFELNSEELTNEDVFLIIKNMISMTYKKEENIDNKKAKEMNYPLLEAIVNKKIMQQDIKGTVSNKRIKKF